MDIKDLKKAIDEKEDISVKELKIKDKNKSIEFEEIEIKPAKSNLKKYLDKFWFLLFKDESWKGWIISVIVLFLFIKLIFFPVLSFITGTALPLAIVESCSMHHSNIFGDYNSWWENHKTKYSQLNITKKEFSDFTMKNGFTKGDILFIIRANPDKIKIGDIIIFQAPTQNPVIHRVIKIQEENGEKIFSTIGDNNNGQLSFEKEIKENQLVGKAILKISPYAGWAKLIFFESSRISQERGICRVN
jgi:signal peptidase I